MANSVWDTYKREGEDDGGYFMRKMDFNDTPRRLTFKDIEWRAQKEDTEEMYKTPDGRELLLTFTENGVDRAFTARSHKDSFIIAMKQAGLEPGDTFEATRKGEGTEMRFTINKVRDDGSVVIEEKNEIPF